MTSRQWIRSDCTMAVLARRGAVAVRVCLVVGLLAHGVGNLRDLSAQVPASQTEGRQIALVTGSTDGLGREVAYRLGASGAHVIVHGRNEERGMEVVQQIQSSGGTARFIRADLGSLAEVRELGETILRDYDRLDLLVNNAGIGRGPEGATREESVDGHELRFAVNYLAGYLLTYMLLPRLEASAPARIVMVSSAGQAPIDFDDVMLERAEYQGVRAYNQSKLAQILFTIDLAEELEGTGIIVNAVHPATFMNTSMVLNRGGTPMATVEEGADAVMNLIMTPDIGTGQYFAGLRVGRPNAQAEDPEARARLRQLSRELTGLN